jgi:hypothetical protein
MMIVLNASDATAVDLTKAEQYNRTPPPVLFFISFLFFFCVYHPFSPVYYSFMCHRLPNRHLKLYGVFERFDGFRQHPFVVVARAEVPVRDGEVGPDGNGGFVARRCLQAFSDVFRF